ncbi:hypothetical protein WJX81_002550 [Elliptochloris bilobata]|uniref:Uncharacterized protein n=1 Tax=Elliptochloris bilobata TaxID=381761 RepID=A0AAW1RIT5_9CHLO
MKLEPGISLSLDKPATGLDGIAPHRTSLPGLSGPSFRERQDEMMKMQAEVLLDLGWSREELEAAGLLSAAEAVLHERSLQPMLEYDRTRPWRSPGLRDPCCTSPVLGEHGTPQRPEPTVAECLAPLMHPGIRTPAEEF